MCRKLESVKVKVWKCEKGSSVARSETQCSAGALPPSGGHTQPFPFYRESNCCWMWGHFPASSISQILSSVFLHATHQSSPHSIESNCCWICEREKDTKPFSASSISQIWSTVFPTKSREAFLLHWRWTSISKKVSLSQTNSSKKVSWVVCAECGVYGWSEKRWSGKWWEGVGTVGSPQGTGRLIWLQCTITHWLYTWL